MFPGMGRWEVLGVRIRRLCKHCLLSHLLFPPLLLQTPFAPESKILNLPACLGVVPFVAAGMLVCCIQSAAEHRADWHGPSMLPVGSPAAAIDHAGYSSS